MYSKSDKFKIRLLGFFSIILLCIAFTVKSFQNDTFYIIKLGEFISKNGVDLMDHYSWVTNLSYTYPHWLYDLFVYFIYSQFGYFGIYFSNIFLFIVLVLCIYFINLRRNYNEFMALLVGVLSIFILKMFIMARSQLVSTILFFLEVYFIEKLIEKGKNKYIIFLILISLLIANLHATVWLFYFVLYLPFIGEYIFYKLRKCHGKEKIYNINDKVLISKVDHIGKLLFTCGVAFLMGFLTPSRICYSYVFRIMMGNSQAYIAEHAPIVLIQHLFFIACLLIVFIILAFSKTKIHLRELLMIGGLMFMCLVSTRYLVFFYTIGIYYISVLCCRYFSDKNDITLDILGKVIVQKKIIYLSLLIIIGIVSCYFSQKNFKEDYVPKDEYPVDAVHYIKENLDVNKMRLYNDYNYGSYLLFQDIPVFVDSRCDLYLREFNGLEYSIFDDAVLIEEEYEEKFSFYGVTNILVSNDSFLCKLLLLDEGYQVLYKDEYFILFEKCEGV